MSAAWCVAVIAAAGGAPRSVAALESWISTGAIERALAIARSSDAERTKFHRPYITEVDAPIGGSMVLARVEAVTEFRRMELIAEAHVALGDTFGRGGIADAEAALRPWRNRITMVAHIRFPFPAQSAMLSMPPIKIWLHGGSPIIPVATERHMTKGSGGIPIAGTVAAIFREDTIASRRAALLVEIDGQLVARVPIDLTALQ